MLCMLYAHPCLFAPASTTIVIIPGLCPSTCWDKKSFYHVLDTMVRIRKLMLLAIACTSFSQAPPSQSFILSRRSPTKRLVDHAWLPQVWGKNTLYYGMSFQTLLSPQPKSMHDSNKKISPSIWLKLWSAETLSCLDQVALEKTHHCDTVMIAVFVITVSFSHITSGRNGTLSQAPYVYGHCGSYLQATGYHNLVGDLPISPQGTDVFLAWGNIVAVSFSHVTSGRNGTLSQAPYVYRHCGSYLQASGYHNLVGDLPISPPQGTDVFLAWSNIVAL